MPLVISGKSIERVSVIDDDRSVRDAYEYAIEELQLKAISEEGPIDNLEQFVQITSSKSDAAICDHHLKVKMYAKFNGAQLVSRWYQNKFPAVLCTRLEGAIHEIRKYRRFIPVLLQPDELEPESMIKGFQRCIEEFGEKFQPSRRPWRTLVRIEEVDAEGVNKSFHIVVPGWNPNKFIQLQCKDVPKEVQSRIAVGARFHASVNIGATKIEDLYFEEWEVD